MSLPLSLVLARSKSFYLFYYLSQTFFISGILLELPQI